MASAPSAARGPLVEGANVVVGLAAVVAGGGAGLLAATSPTTATALILTALVAAAFYARPEWALLGWLVLAPQDVEAFYLLPLAGGAVALVLAMPRIPGKRVALCLGALILVMLPSLPLLPSPDEHQTRAALEVPVLGWAYAQTPSAELQDWLHLGTRLVAFCLAAWAIRSAASFERLVVVILAAASVPILVGLHQQVSGQTDTRQGFAAIRGTFAHPSLFGYYLVVVLVLALVTLIEARTLVHRVLAGGLLTAGGTCLLLTFSRGAWIAFALAIVLLSLITYRRLMIVGVIGLVLAGVAFPATVAQVDARFRDLSSNSSRFELNSFDWRLGEWKQMVGWGLSAPVLGNGFGSYQPLTIRQFGSNDPDYGTRNDHLASNGRPAPDGFPAHNDFLKMFVEGGVVGLGLWIAFYVAMFSVAWRARAVAALRPQATAVAVLVVALGVSSNSDNIQAFVLLLLCVLCLVGGLAGAQRGEDRALRE